MSNTNKLNCFDFLALSTISAPTLAEAINVNVYGKLNADFESAKNDKAALATNAASLNRLVSNGSYLGFKGDKNLGSKLSGLGLGIIHAF